MLIVHIPKRKKSDRERRLDDRDVGWLALAVALLLLFLFALRIYFNDELRAREERQHPQQVEECRTDPEGCVTKIQTAEKKG